MRSGIIGLTVVAVSALGFSATAVDKARAYVTKRPEGAYAPLALQFLVELEARRMLDASGELVDGRRSLVGDLVFRPAGRTKLIKIYGESTSSSEGKELREPLSGSQNTSVRQAQKALEYLQIRFKRLQRDTTRCDRIRRKRPYLDCIADAVDQFADRGREDAEDRAFGRSGRRSGAARDALGASAPPTRSMWPAPRWPRRRSRSASRSVSCRRAARIRSRGWKSASGRSS